MLLKTSITVIIPTFNRRDFIVDAVQSVLLQDIGDLEIIIYLIAVIAPFFRS